MPSTPAHALSDDVLVIESFSPLSLVKPAKCNETGSVPRACLSPALILDTKTPHLMYLQPVANRAFALPGLQSDLSLGHSDGLYDCHYRLFGI